ncbi:PASTA domain-containing protein [Paenibacillus koleovorans]|uniref:PASTA domain-containing protein n=1 Tax=Paenibacillus koleovorans TaxID=121608 RepID=UPI0013E38E5A|nr:PASTA domain-containing protein [Paenibacillus koleovorans]
MKSNRYELKEFLALHHNGRLYRGEDLSLKRPVLIYAVPVQAETSVSNYTRKIGNSMQELTHLQFMHILDIEVADDTIYVIIHHKPGSILQQFVQNESISFLAALTMLVQLGRTLLDAAEERSLHFSLAASNIWITDNRTINIINTWDNPEPEQHDRMSKKLSLLFVQLVTRTLDVPLEDHLFDFQLRRTLSNVPVGSRQEAAKNVFTDAWKERLSLVAFVQGLESLRDGMQGNLRMAAGTSSSPTQLPPQSETEPAPSMEEESEAEATAAKKGVSRLAPSRREEADEAHVYEDEEEEYEEDDDEYEEGQSGRGMSTGKKWAIGIALSAFGLAVFVGVFALLITKLDLNGDPPASPTPSSSATVGQSASPTPTPKPSATSNTPSPTVSEMVSVPTLTGMTQGAAEQEALASGLRYEYFLETNAQPAGIVFKQNPAPGGTVARGTRVSFWISKGP